MSSEIFEYAAVRVVPRVERGEFINAGVILYSKSYKFLRTRIDLNGPRLLALDPAADVDTVRAGLTAFERACGDGPLAECPLGERFRWLTAPRSAMVQPGPVHSGITADPAADLDRLFTRLVAIGPRQTRLFLTDLRSSPIPTGSLVLRRYQGQGTPGSNVIPGTYYREEGYVQSGLSRQKVRWTGMPWQVQEAKQRFSELLRAANQDGPQVVTRHGEEIAVVIDIAEFHRLRGDVQNFKDFLRAGPDFEDLELTRRHDLPREIDWTDDA